MAKLSDFRPVPGAGGGGGGIKGNWDVTPASGGAADVADIYPEEATYVDGVLTSPATSSSLLFVDGAVVTFTSTAAFVEGFSKFLTIVDESGGGSYVAVGLIDSGATAENVRDNLEAAFFNTAPVGAVTQLHLLAYFTAFGTWNTTSFFYTGGAWQSTGETVNGAGEKTFLMSKTDGVGNVASYLTGLSSLDGNITFTDIANVVPVTEGVDVDAGFFDVTLRPFFAVFTVAAPFGTHSATEFTATFNPTSTLDAVSVPVDSDFDVAFTPDSQADFDLRFPTPYLNGLAVYAEAEFPNGTEVNDQYRIVGEGAPYGVSTTEGDIIVVDSVTSGEETFRIAQYQPLPPVYIPASEVPYDNATSGLTAIDVQGAVDEIEGRLDITEGVATDANTTADSAYSLADSTNQTLTIHLNSTSAHDASEIVFDDTNAGLGVTRVQPAIEVLATQISDVNSDTTDAFLEVHIVSNSPANSKNTFPTVEEAWDVLAARLNAAANTNACGTIWIDSATAVWNIGVGGVTALTSGRIQILGNRSRADKPTISISKAGGTIFSTVGSVPYMDYVILELTNNSISTGLTFCDASVGGTWRIGSDVTLGGIYHSNYEPSELLSFWGNSTFFRIPSRANGNALTIEFDENFTISATYNDTSNYHATITGDSPYTATYANLKVVGQGFRVACFGGMHHVFAGVGLHVEDTGHFKKDETPRTRIPSASGMAILPANQSIIETKLIRYDVGSTAIHWQTYYADAIIGGYAWGVGSGDNTILLPTNSLYSHGGFSLGYSVVDVDLDYFCSGFGEYGNKVTVETYGTGITVSPVDPSDIVMGTAEIYTFIVGGGGTWKVMSSSV